jgi:hypothetical protein
MANFNVPSAGREAVYQKFAGRRGRKAPQIRAEGRLESGAGNRQPACIQNTSPQPSQALLSRQVPHSSQTRGDEKQTDKTTHSDSTSLFNPKFPARLSKRPSNPVATRGMCRRRQEGIFLPAPV